MMARDVAARAALACLAIAGACERPGAEDDGPEPVTSADRPAEVHPAAMARPGVLRLGADERRGKLIVLPADAQVEIDGVPMRRRNGIIELSGKLGQRYGVRLSRGPQNAETTVTLGDAGASPAALDLVALALAQAARPLGPGRLPLPHAAEPAPVLAAPEPSATADPSHEAALPEAMRASAHGNEGPACVCPPAPEVIVYKCPNGAGGKKPKGVLAGDSFE